MSALKVEAFIGRWRVPAWAYSVDERVGLFTPGRLWRLLNRLGWRPLVSVTFWQPPRNFKAGEVPTVGPDGELR